MGIGKADSFIIIYVNTEPVNGSPLGGRINPKHHLQKCREYRLEKWMQFAQRWQHCLSSKGRYPLTSFSLRTFQLFLWCEFLLPLLAQSTGYRAQLSTSSLLQILHVLYPKLASEWTSLWIQILRECLWLDRRQLVTMLKYLFWMACSNLKMLVTRLLCRSPSGPYVRLETWMPIYSTLLFAYSVILTAFAQRSSFPPLPFIFEPLLLYPGSPSSSL